MPTSLYTTLKKIENVSDSEAQTVADKVAYRDDTATKIDIEKLIAENKVDLEALRVATKADLEALRLATKADLEALRVATKADLEALRVTTKASLEKLKAETKADLANLETRLTRQMYAVAGIVIAAVSLIVKVF